MYADLGVDRDPQRKLRGESVDTTTGAMAEPGKALRGRLGALALWLMPWTVILEWVGGTFYKSIPLRLAYLALFLGLYWLSFPMVAASPPNKVVRWGVGGAALLTGAAIATYALGWSLGGELGWPPQPRPRWLDVEALKLLCPLIAAWPLAIGSELVAGGAVGARAFTRLGAFLALGFLLHFAAHIHVQGLPVLRAAPLWPFALVLSLLATVSRGPFVARLGLLLASGFALRWLGLAVWQIDPRVRDMLALVQSAQDRFASGHNPYDTLYAMQHDSVLPLTYLPGMWLGYGVPRLFGFDLRWFGPCMEVLLFAAMAKVSTRIEASRRAWAEAFVFTFAAIWFFSPSVQWNAIYAEPTWWWCLLGATLLFSFAGPYWFGALLLGLAIATRHFAIVLAPFVILYFVRVRGLRASLPLLAITGGTAALLLFSFAVGSPELFWFGTVRWLREYGPAHLSWFLDRFGFLSLFVEHGALKALPFVQAGVVLACSIGAFFVRASRVASFAATAALLFIMFNVLLWDSFLLDGAMASAALFVSAPLRREKADQALSERTFYGAISVLALTLIAAAYLAFTLVTTLHPSGRGEAHDYLVARVKPGDFVIDRSDRRIAFVQGSWLLRREEVPAPIGGDFYDPAWAGRSALTAPGKVWLITEARRDRAMRATFRKLGAVEQPFGDYRVQAFHPEPSKPVELTAGRARRCQIGWTDYPMRALVVQQGQPVKLPLAGHGTLMLAAGFTNDLVSWPHRSVIARIGERAFEVPNLHGVSFTSFDVAANAELELSTDDPTPRELCVELSWL